jgi:hypothetical protein
VPAALQRSAQRGGDSDELVSGDRDAHRDSIEPLAVNAIVR